MKAQLIGATMLATAFVGGEAQAAGCALSQFIAPVISATYDPFEDSFVPVPVAVTAQTSGSCKGARVQLAVTPSPTDPQTGSQVRLKQGSAVLLGTIEANGQPKPIVNAGAAFSISPISLAVGSGGDLTGGTSFKLDLALGQIVPPGNYSAVLSLLARVSDSNSRQVSDRETPLIFNVLVKPSVRLATGGGDLSIQLGELKPGLMGGPVNFSAYANVDYNLVIKSENGFVLRPNGTGNAAGVPYTPLLSNAVATSVAAQGSSEIHKMSFTVPASGFRRHSLRVRVEKFSNLTAGRYSDIMTVEIGARI